MLKVYKYRIYPNKEQKMIFSKIFGCVRFVYNKMLADRMES
ncbi:cytosine methyltransferase [Bacillus thuringiensis serovar yunnanensis]|nr:cytosine methyltransferase [Bacillus thuringiensis serovar yunnanensis]